MQWRRNYMPDSFIFVLFRIFSHLRNTIFRRFCFFLFQYHELPSSVFLLFGQLGDEEATESGIELFDPPNLADAMGVGYDVIPFCLILK